MHFLSKLDIFKQPICLKIEKDNNVSTHFGKLFTCFIIFYIVYTLFESDLVLHRNPTFKSENFRPFVRTPIHFNYSNFIFAVGLSDENLGYIVEPTVASFSASLFFQNNSNNSIEEIPLEMKLCSEEDFINGGENFKNSNKHNLFCFLLENKTIDLFGYWNEKETQLLTLSLNRCKNSSENNITCRSSDEQEKFLEGKYQDIIFQNDALEYSDYLHPIKKDIAKHYVLIDASLSKLIKTSLKHLSLISDDGFFFENFKKEDSYAVESMVYDIQSNNFEKDLPLVQIEMSVDNQETINSRKYQHVQDLLAEMGGVLNILMIFGFLLANIEIPYVITKKISSELYSYNINKNEMDKEEILEPFDLGKFKDNKPKGTAKSFRTIDFPSNDIKMISKKLLILKNEPFVNINELSMSSDSQRKENSADQKSIQNEDLIYSERSINRTKLNFRVKIPTMKGDEDAVFEKNSESEFIQDNAKMQKRNDTFNSNNIITNFKIKNQKQRVSILQTAIKFSIDLKNKLGFTRLLEHYMNRGKKNFPITFKAYLSILFKCRKFKLNQREKLFLLGEEQIQKDLDVFKIINCMNDLEKLKMILLNDKQRLLFNLLQKPIITTKPIIQEFEKNELIVDGIKKNRKRSIIESSYKDLLANSTKSDIDKRILRLVDKNLVNLNSLQ